MVAVEAMTDKPHFSLLATSFAGGPRRRWVVSIVFGLWAVLFFAALFSPPLLDDADATHAQAARAMVTTGDLVTLKVDGVRYLEKAPLPYWLAAASFKVFGFNTFAAHLPQALAVLLLALLGHRWANQAFGARTGFYTSIAILTSAGVFLFTRVLIPEVLLSLLLGAALFAFLKTLGPIAVEARPIFLPDGAIAERPGVAWYAGPNFYPAVMWNSLGFAVLTKGLVALVFFGGTALAFLALTAEFGKWRLFKPFWGVLLFLAIAAPWHVLAGLRNPGGALGGANGHGFWWFYFWNEHVLRFLGRREPRDYNKLPGYLFWTLHVVWIFPWSLFLPLGATAIWRRFQHQTVVLTNPAKPSGIPAWWLAIPMFVVAWATGMLVHVGIFEVVLLVALVTSIYALVSRRRAFGLPLSPFHRIDPQQRSILTLSLFAGIILIFFSLSTNQEYYTFPAYLPILLLIAATITRAEQTYSSSPSAQRWIGFAHATLTLLCAAFSVALIYGLWGSRHLPYVPDIGDLLAHRGVGDYTLSMSHFFDLTTESFAGLRLPATLAAIVFALGPGLAWMLRRQRRHVAATTAIAFTAAGFLFAAHIALARFAPMLSSLDLAERIQELEDDQRISRETQVLLYGDQAYGSSIPFYLGETVDLVNARSSSMLFGSTFPDAPHVFLTTDELMKNWGQGERKILFVPLEKRDEVDQLLGSRQIVIEETSGKALITDRPLEVGCADRSCETNRK